MKVSYKKLWVKLAENDLKKTEFAKKAGISSVTMAKLGKGSNVTTDVLLKICKTLNCDFCDIMEVVKNDKNKDR